MDTGFISKCRKLSFSNFDFDGNGTLLRYHGEYRHISLPDGITVIGVEAFFGIDDLVSVIIPEGVIEIKLGAFSLCDELKNVVLPNTLKVLDAQAFGSCSSLEKITIPYGCEIVGEYCFADCEKLEEIFIPPTVHTIYHGAFETFNDNTLLHVAEGSVAEKAAIESGWRFDYSLFVSPLPAQSFMTIARF